MADEGMSLVTMIHVHGYHGRPRLSAQQRYYHAPYDGDWVALLHLLMATHGLAHHRVHAGNRHMLWHHMQ